MKKGVYFLLLASLVVSSTGCYQSLDKSGDVKYSNLKGTFEAEIPYKVEQIYFATLKAIKELKLTTISKDRDKLVGIIMARNAKGEEIEVNINALEEQKSQVIIRVSPFGNMTQSKLIFNEIKKNL